MKEYYEQLLTEEYRLSDAYHQFCTENPANRFSVLTWEILRDAHFEFKTGVWRQEEKDDPFFKKIETFCQENSAAHGELTPDDLEKIKGILNRIPEQTKNSTRAMNVIYKLRGKVQDSGVPLVSRKSVIHWRQLRFSLDLLKNIPEELKVPAADLTEFGYETRNKKGELDVASCAVLSEQINQFQKAYQAISESKKVTPKKLSFKARFRQLFKRSKNDIKVSAEIKNMPNKFAMVGLFFEKINTYNLVGNPQDEKTQLVGLKKPHG